jgi:hypothetical protein
MGKSLNNTIEILHHLYSYLDQNRGDENDAIKHSIEDLMKATPDLDSIVETFKPYKDEIILLLIEALNLPKNKTFSLHSNALYILEQIGDHDVVSLMMDNFNDYVERFNFSFTKTLTAIAAREGRQTGELVVGRYIKFFVDEDNSAKKRRQSEMEDHRYESILVSLNRIKILDDPRLVAVLEKYVVGTRENSVAHKLALFILAKIDKKRAADIVNENLRMYSSVTTEISRQQVRSVSNPVENDVDRAFIALFVSNAGKENPYLFEFDDPLIYFFEDGSMSYWTASLAGVADRQEDAIDAASHYLNIRTHHGHLPQTRLQESYEILSKHLSFENFGFKQSYIQPEKYPTFIYDSEWCRVKFMFDGSGDQHDPKMHLQVYYGRLHAPSNKTFMVLNNERHWCWHKADFALNFLDGLSPQEAIKVKHYPRVIAHYRESDIAAELSKLSQAEWMVGMTSEIWRHYGQELFEIFDLRYSDQWVQYNSFVNAVYEIDQPNSYGTPPYNNIY